MTDGVRCTVVQDTPVNGFIWSSIDSDDLMLFLHVITHTKPGDIPVTHPACDIPGLTPKHL